jgi:hypothetical protein
MLRVIWNNTDYRHDRFSRRRSGARTARLPDDLRSDSHPQNISWLGTESAIRRVGCAGRGLGWPVIDTGKRNSPCRWLRRFAFRGPHSGQEAPASPSHPAISHSGKLVAYASDREGSGGLAIWTQPFNSEKATRLTRVSLTRPIRIFHRMTARSCFAPIGIAAESTSYPWLEARRPGWWYETD